MKQDIHKGMDIITFNNTYWLKEELVAFCKAHNLSSHGGKLEITKRIETFLRTGKVEVNKKTTNKSNKYSDDSHLTLDTVIRQNHRCSQKVRAFFKSVIGPRFYFSTFIQDYFRNNVGKLYRDVVSAWNAHEFVLINKNFKKDIPPQFKYNTYIRDFYLDSKNKGKSRGEAITSWNKRKSIPGDHKYSIIEGF